MISFAIVALMAANEPAVTNYGGSPVAAHMQGPWALSAFEGRSSRRLAEAVALRFNQDRSISGTAACNATSAAKLRWRGSPDDPSGAFDQEGRNAGITTTVMCNDKQAVAVADRFWSALATAKSWAISKGELRLEFADGTKARLVAVYR